MAGRAREQATAICALLDDCDLEVVDVTVDAARAVEDRVLGLPALISLGQPPRRVVGDLSNAQVVADYLRR
jgi:hypothetical protein